MHTFSRKYTLYVTEEDKKTNIRRFVSLQNNVKILQNSAINSPEWLVCFLCFGFNGRLSISVYYQDDTKKGRKRGKGIIG